MGKGGREMDASVWEELLRHLSEELLRDPDSANGLPADVRASGWLGYPGATEDQIARAEDHLGVTLPLSYRTFLKVSNGWRRTIQYVQLWSTEEIEWFSVRNQGWIDIVNENPLPVSDADYFVYGEEQKTYNMRSEYMTTALEISDNRDSAVYLLNPRVVTAEGEWEAWEVANYPGAARFRTFDELMRDEYAMAVRLRDMRGGS